MILPSLSSSIAVGPLVGWMVVLTIKHVLADFVLQNSWMAVGKDQKTGWALPLLAHCLVHLVLALLLILVIVVDRAKGICVSAFDVTYQHPWFWTLIGVDQTLHHLTGFGLAIVMAFNA